jgi:raffinose/stachyose/melibiose transport system permease protein
MFGISLVFALGYQRFVLRRDLEGAATTMRGAGT